jgi:hypothetical protein
MRSELVYSAGRAVKNRFLLATLTMRIVGALHVDSTRTQDTANRAFCDIAEGKFSPGVLPAPPQPPVIEPLLISPAA